MAQPDLPAAVVRNGSAGAIGELSGFGSAQPGFDRPCGIRGFAAADGGVPLWELFPRVGFIVTNLKADRPDVVRFYNKRGTAEQWIKEGKQAVKMTRLSCH